MTHTVTTSTTTLTTGSPTAARLTAASVLLGILAAILVVLAPAPAHAARIDKDCTDFATQAEAQAFFIAEGGPAADPHRIDTNHDGTACERQLPCPCVAGEAATPIWVGTPPPAGTFVPGYTPLAPVTTTPATLVKVVNAETVRVRVDNRTMKVKLSGVAKRSCQKAKAVKVLTKLLKKGSLKLVTDSITGDHRPEGILVRYVDNNVDVGKKMIARGYARSDNSVKYDRMVSYEAAELNARNSGRGTWASGACR